MVLVNYSTVRTYITYVCAMYSACNVIMLLSACMDSNALFLGMYNINILWVCVHMVHSGSHNLPIKLLYTGTEFGGHMHGINVSSISPHIIYVHASMHIHHHHASTRVYAITLSISYVGDYRTWSMYTYVHAHTSLVYLNDQCCAYVRYSTHCSVPSTLQRSQTDPGGNIGILAC